MYKWMDEAACSESNPEIFFLALAEADAKKICKTCPVANECLLYALKSDLDYGVWGGMSESERKQLRKLGSRFRHLKK